MVTRQSKLQMIFRFPNHRLIGLTKKKKEMQDQPVVRAIGYLNSEILQLGPSFESLVA